MTDARACAVCAAGLDTRQEYCVECGARVGAAPRRPAHWLWPASAAALLAAGATAAAIAAGTDDSQGTTVVALSPMRTVPGSAPDGPAATATPVLSWPLRDGHTVVVAAIPEAAGRQAAAARAREATASGLPDVGILESARFASLHPGYLIVFSGIYAGRDEALRALPGVARRFRNAYAQEIVR